MSSSSVKLASSYLSSSHTWMLTRRLRSGVRTADRGVCGSAAGADVCGGVSGIYSHVTSPMIAAMLDGLQRRWGQYGSTDAVTSTWMQVWSRSVAPNLLPQRRNGPSVMITNRPSDQCV